MPLLANCLFVTADYSCFCKNTFYKIEIYKKLLMIINYDL